MNETNRKTGGVGMGLTEGMEGEGTDEKHQRNTLSWISFFEKRGLAVIILDRNSSA